LSSKLVPTFADRLVRCGQCDESGASTFSSKTTVSLEQTASLEADSSSASHIIIKFLRIVEGCVRLAIPVTGPQACETWRLPHSLDNRLTYGGEVVQPYAPAALCP
jgi:hypothetical protein